MANGGDAKTCSERTNYVGPQTIPGSTEGGGINYEESLTDVDLTPIEARRKICQGQVDEMMQRARDAGVSNPRFPTRHYAGCMKGVISQQFFKEMWCEVAPDWSKDVISSGGCAAYYSKKKGSKTWKAIKIAACTGIVAAVGECE